MISDSNKTYGNDLTAIADLVNEEGLQGSLTVGTSAVEVKVGTSRLLSRKVVTLHNNSNSILYWGYTSAVTTATGTPIFKDQFLTWEVGDQVAVFVISASAGNNTRITEGA